MAESAPLDLAHGAFSTVDDDRAGGTAWRTITRILWQYLRSDMRDMEDQRKLKFPVTWANHTLKPVPLARRLALEQAQLYLNPPQRTFTGVSEQQEQRLRAVYQGMVIDEIMLNAHQQLCCLNNATVWVWPMRSGGVRLLLVPPHDQSVEMADPTSHNEDDVSRWFVRLPVGQNVTTGTVTYATAVVTNTRAVWCADAPENLAGKGLWRDDGSNPLGFIPAVRLRNALPAPGEFFSPANEALLLCQRAVSSDATSIGVVAQQAHGQAYIKGVPHAAAAEIELGPETVIGLSDPDHEFGFAQADPRLDGYRMVVDHYLKMSVAMQGMSPATVLKSSALTALAKRLDNLDRDVERRRHLSELLRGERRILRSVVAWLNFQAGVDLLPTDADLTISYREPVQIVDELHAAQSLERLVAMGLTSPAEELAKREAISEPEAAERVRANLEARAALSAETGDDAATLNGAQVLAALSVAERVGTGALTIEGGVAFMVEGLGVTEDAARRVLSGARPLVVVD